MSTLWGFGADFDTGMLLSYMTCYVRQHSMSTARMSEFQKACTSRTLCMLLYYMYRGDLNSVWLLLYTLKDIVLDLNKVLNVEYYII